MYITAVLNNDWERVCIRYWLTNINDRIMVVSKFHLYFLMILQFHQQILSMTKERELMKSQVLKLEQDLEKSKTMTSTLREERDAWRKKVSAHGEVLHLA